MLVTETMDKKLTGIGSNAIRRRVEDMRVGDAAMGMRIAFFVGVGRQNEVLEAFPFTKHDRTDAVVMDNPTFDQFRRVIEHEAVERVSLATILVPDRTEANAQARFKRRPESPGANRW